MPMSSLILKVWRIEQTCLFELSWQGERTLSAKMPFSATLTTLYTRWQTAYLSFYRSNLRARPGIALSLAQPEDWRAKLAQAEAVFLAEFHHWLNHASLIEIRREIAQAASRGQPVNLYIRCDSLEMVKLPWESWQIGTEFGTTNPIRILRTAANLRRDSIHPIRRQRARILVILGDDTGLDFQAEKEAVQNLTSLAEVQFTGWRSDDSTADVKTEVCQAIADPQGWDILFFAGHSNETIMTGGQLAIAPNTSVLVSEIAQYLKVAQERGLQFAIFNSCNGSTIADELINLGLSQVVVMREPIHNQIAKEFLLQFLQHLVAYQDVQTAVLSACQSLKLEKNLTYPSAYLIPSLFSDPQTQPFQLKKTGWKQKLAQWKPNRREAIALTVFALMSSLLPVQSWLIEQRQSVQAIYRSMTVAPTQSVPPTLLVQIDEESLQKGKVDILNQNIDRQYLAKLVNRSAALNASVVGLDYLLFRHQPGGDPALSKALEAAAKQKGTQFVFAAKLEEVQSPAKWIKAVPELINPQWRIDGDMDLLGNPALYARAIGDTDGQTEMLPLAYELVRTQARSSRTHQWDTRSQYSLVSQVAAAFGQMWFHPLIDYTVPIQQVYQTIPAWKFLETPQLPNLSAQIVLITPGGHLDAGVKSGEDNFISPQAFNYWKGGDSKMTGGEIHAYLIHNLLHRRLVIPVPDLWMLGLAALLGKGIGLRDRKSKWLAGPSGLRFALIAPVFYVAISLQLYASIAILLPIVFPTLTYLFYLSAMRRQRNV